MKFAIRLVLAGSLLVACGCSDAGGMTSLSLDELCGTMYEYEGERIRVEAHVDRETRCKDEECPDTDVTCNACVTSFLLNCQGPNDHWDDGDVSLWAQEDINLPGVSLTESGGGYYFDDIPTAIKLGCVGSEDDLLCSPANPDEIVSLIGTVDVYGHLGVHEVELR